uniref:Complement C1q-like protein 3 n=1 Tax=Crassostrea virginica TaxID=6565 RepID=A0A8B8BCU7_CRAVI|nr:complement C1q-like protein 3 [Crassostrea virginica]
MLNIPKLIIVCCAVLSLRCVQATSPPQFLKDINGYRSACKSIGWEPKQDCAVYNVVAFHANLNSHLNNLDPNTTIKFENVQLNKGNGYDPNTGIFTAPEDGVYSFAWSFLSKVGGTVYLAAVIENADHAHTCIGNQQSSYISASGHLLYELKEGNKVWLRTWHVPATFIHSGYYSYFSGSKINSL